jgi:hypothetical protein
MAAEEAGAGAADAGTEDVQGTPRARMAPTTWVAQKCTVAEDDKYGA